VKGESVLEAGRGPKKVIQIGGSGENGDLGVGKGVEGFALGLGEEEGGPRSDGQGKRGGGPQEITILWVPLKPEQRDKVSVRKGAV